MYRDSGEELDPGSAGGLPEVPGAWCLCRVTLSLRLESSCRSEVQGHGGQGAEVQDQVHMNKQEDERTATQPQQRQSQAGDPWGARSSLPASPLAHTLGGQTAGWWGLSPCLRHPVQRVYVWSFVLLRLTSWVWFSRSDFDMLTPSYCPN